MIFGQNWGTLEACGEIHGASERLQHDQTSKGKEEFFQVVRCYAEIPREY